MLSAPSENFVNFVSYSFNVTDLPMVMKYAFFLCFLLEVWSSFSIESSYFGELQKYDHQ
jgi:hypothetical protein